MKKLKNYGLFLFIASGLLLLSCSENVEKTKPSETAAVVASDTDSSDLKQKSNTSNEKVIGEYDSSGNLTITADITEIKSIFQNQLTKNGVTTTLDKIEIHEDVVEGTSDKYYCLLGVNTDGTIKIVTQLFTSSSSSGVLVAQMSSASDTFKKTCTCTGTCQKGCNPRLYRANDGEYDYMCTPCSNSTNCVKSVSDSI